MSTSAPGAIPEISGLSAVAERYDALLCDAWGVIHNGRELYPGAAEAMIRFRETRGPVVILTNAPRPSEVIPAQLDRLGLPREAYDAVVTSGDATRAELEARAPGPAYRLGPDKDDPLFAVGDLSFAPIDEARFIVCTGLVDDHADEPEDYRPLLQTARERNLEMVCANPDIVVRWGDRMIWCAGALAEIYREIGGRVVYTGKPHAPIYRLAQARIEAAAGRVIEPKRVLAVGDGLKTDILGANKQNLDAVFVADGIHAEGVRDARGALIPEKVAAILGAEGVSAVAAMQGLAW